MNHFQIPNAIFLSSISSSSVALIFFWMNSSNFKLFTIYHSPFLHTHGYENIKLSDWPYLFPSLITPIETNSPGFVPTHQSTNIDIYINHVITMHMITCCISCTSSRRLAHNWYYLCSSLLHFAHKSIFQKSIIIDSFSNVLSLSSI
jgi:hypothetical protein